MSKTKGFTVRKSDEKIVPRNLLTVLYGLPGVGKTSLTFTLPKPILHFDFDKGLTRAVQAIRPDSVEINDYGDFHQYIMSDDFAKYIQENGYKSVSPDTIGTMLDDFVAPWLITINPKNSNGSSLSLQGWGQLAVTFNMFKTRLQNLGLEIGVVCHVKEDGEDRALRLDVKGSTTSILYRSADLIGYVYKDKGNRFVDFSPSNGVGKDTGRFGSIQIPDPSDPSYENFLANIIEECKKKMGEESEGQLKVKEALNAYKEKIDAAKTTSDFDAIVNEIASEESKALKVQVKKIFGEALKNAGFFFNKESKKIEASPVAEPEKEEANENS